MSFKGPKWAKYIVASILIIIAAYYIFPNSQVSHADSHGSECTPITLFLVPVAPKETEIREIEEIETKPEFYTEVEFVEDVLHSILNLLTHYSCKGDLLRDFHNGKDYRITPDKISELLQNLDPILKDTPEVDALKTITTINKKLIDIVESREDTSLSGVATDDVILLISFGEDISQLQDFRNEFLRLQESKPTLIDHVLILSVNDRSSTKNTLRDHRIFYVGKNPDEALVERPQPFQVVGAFPDILSDLLEPDGAEWDGGSPVRLETKSLDIPVPGINDPKRWKNNLIIMGDSKELDKLKVIHEKDKILKPEIRLDNTQFIRVLGITPTDQIPAKGDESFIKFEEVQRGIAGGFIDTSRITPGPPPPIMDRMMSAWDSFYAKPWGKAVMFIVGLLILLWVIVKTPPVKRFNQRRREARRNRS